MNFSSSQILSQTNKTRRQKRFVRVLFCLVSWNCALCVKIRRCSHLGMAYCFQPTKANTCNIIDSGRQSCWMIWSLKGPLQVTSACAHTVVDKYIVLIIQKFPIFYCDEYDFRSPSLENIVRLSMGSSPWKDFLFLLLPKSNGINGKHKCLVLS